MKPLVLKVSYQASFEKNQAIALVKHCGGKVHTSRMVRGVAIPRSRIEVVVRSTEQKTRPQLTPYGTYATESRKLKSRRGPRIQKVIWLLPARIIA